MLINTLINRKATIKIANALEELISEVVFVGGAMVSLYIDDPAANDIRPTKDIDLTFKIVTLGELENLRLKLLDKGFTQSMEDDVICRFRYEDMKVDVMSTKEVGWAPSNRWFGEGFDHAMDYDLGEIAIRILTLPYFLATKLEAFYDRGKDDLYLSHDFEDIVYLINYTSTLPDQILSGDPEVMKYLVEQLRIIINDPDIMNAMPGHLYFEETEERMDIIVERINRIISY